MRRRGSTRALSIFFMMYAESGGHTWEAPLWLGGLVGDVAAGTPTGIPMSIYFRSLHPLVVTVIVLGLLGAGGMELFYGVLISGH